MPNPLGCLACTSVHCTHTFYIAWLVRGGGRSHGALWFTSQQNIYIDIFLPARYAFMRCSIHVCVCVAAYSNKSISNNLMLIHTYRYIF